MEARSGLRLTRDQVPPIYALADTGVLGPNEVPDAVRILAEVGIAWIQLRAKALDDRSLYGLVERCLELIEALPKTRARPKIWINDRADLASLFPNTALHLGQQDLPPLVARSLIGEEAWIGQSTHDLDQLQIADSDPDVNVIALGPIYETASKKNPEATVGLETLRRARALTDKPLVAIGGIHVERAGEVLAAGADSVAVIGAICHGDLRRNSQLLMEAVAESPRRRGRWTEKRTDESS